MNTVPLILPTPTSTAETIHEVELAYHRVVIERVKQIAAMETQIQQLQREVIEIDGSRKLWMAHLSQRYQLANGDTINEHGVIARVAPPDGGG
jgi:TolA-binding protein